MTPSAEARADCTDEATVSQKSGVASEESISAICLKLATLMVVFSLRVGRKHTGCVLERGCTNARAGSGKAVALAPALDRNSL